MQLLIIFSAFLGLFLSLTLLLHKRGNRNANRLLAMLILILSIQLLKYVDLGLLDLITPTLALIASVLIFMLGPLLLFYAKALFGIKLSNQPIYLHFIPSFIALIVAVSVVVYATIVGKEELAGNEALLSSFFFVYVFTQIVHMLIYNLKTYKVINRGLYAFEDSFSNLERINVNWLKHVSIGFTLIIFITSIFYVMLITGGYYTFTLETDYGFIISISLMINYAGFRALNQPEIISGELMVPKYHNSKLNADDIKAYKTRILHFMEDDKPYQECNFKLNDMAKHVSLSPHILSQMINEHFNQNFFEFINSYRIKMAKEKMREANWKTQTILGVAFEVGYNSKSAFNRAFKKFEGSTPSEYLKTIR